MQDEKYIKLSTAQGFLSHLANSYYSSAKRLEGHPQHLATKNEYDSNGDLCVTIARELESMTIKKPEVKDATAVSI